MNASAFGSLIVNTEYFSTIDNWIFGALLVCSVAIGVYYAILAKGLETVDEYLHGGHKMQVLPIAISLVARFVFLFN